jgi:hypothetical protein
MVRSRLAALKLEPSQADAGHLSGSGKHRHDERIVVGWFATPRQRAGRDSRHRTPARYVEKRNTTA